MRWGGGASQAELHVGAHSPLSVLRWRPRVSDENTSTYGVVRKTKEAHIKLRWALQMTGD